MLVRPEKASMISKIKTEFFTLSKLAGACILAQLSQVLLILIDNVMAGQHGTETLAAFGVATQILIPVLIVSMGFFFSINAIVANQFG
jgi:MATE family multidrug resistance protein